MVVREREKERYVVDALDSVRVWQSTLRRGVSVSVRYLNDILTTIEKSGNTHEAGPTIFFVRSWGGVVSTLLERIFGLGLGGILNFSCQWLGCLSLSTPESERLSLLCLLTTTRVFEDIIISLFAFSLSLSLTLTLTLAFTMVSNLCGILLGF